PREQDALALPAREKAHRNLEKIRPKPRPQKCGARVERSPGPMPEPGLRRERERHEVRPRERRIERESRALRKVPDARRRYLLPAFTFEEDDASFAGAQDPEERLDERRL